MNNCLSFKLSNGFSIPSVGLGTWKAHAGCVGTAVIDGLKCGYTHFDCALVYKNELEIGQAFSNYFMKEKEKHCSLSGNPIVKRDQLFLTSKLWNHHHRHVEIGCSRTLKNLKTDYLDLYLIHWPLAFQFVDDSDENLAPKDENGVLLLDHDREVMETWKDMELLVQKGMVRSIGVANFNIRNLKTILADCTIKPAVNQVELHPYLPQHDLMRFCKDNGIHVTAYSPLGHARGNPKLIDNTTVVEIAHKYRKTPAQILLKWGIRRGTSVIPKSTHVDRIRSNIELFDFALDSRDIDEIDAINQHISERFVNSTNWHVDVFED